MGGVSVGSEREKVMREARRARVHDEMESVTVFLKGYRRMNDSVSSNVDVSCVLLTGDGDCRWRSNRSLRKQTCKPRFLLGDSLSLCVRMRTPYLRLDRVQWNMRGRRAKSWSCCRKTMMRTPCRRILRQVAVVVMLLTGLTIDVARLAPVIAYREKR